MAQSLTLRKERTHFRRPSLPPQTRKSPSVERPTQQARELLRGQQPQEKFPDNTVLGFLPAPQLTHSKEMITEGRQLVSCQRA